MEISPMFFFLFSGIAIAAAINVVLRKNPVGSAFSLVLSMLALAGVYAMLNAHLIAAMQVLVYAGAVMVLFVFVIMLLNVDIPSIDLGRVSLGFKLLASILTAGMLGFFVWVFRNSDLKGIQGKMTPEAIQAAGGNTQVISELMFSEYLLPFELTSVLLLAAIVGAVAIAMRKSKNEKAST